MYNDLPPHLQTLNALPSSSSPPSAGAFSAEQEEQFWSFLNTDELFSNFGLAPQAFESKQALTERKAAAPSPETATAASTASADEDKPATATTLESFLATFAGEIGGAGSTANAGTTLSSASAFLANLASVKPSDVLPSAPASTPAAETPAAADADEERVTGAKRLKMIGAGVAEIEEDKRRRNTEASARFRAKKKQREQALEDRAKELEAQVATLAAEKASLEKENNLLKFVIVNGQGNGGAAATADGLQAALAALGKRKVREE